MMPYSSAVTARRSRARMPGFPHHLFIRVHPTEARSCAGQRNAAPEWARRPRD
jgi:hypothetical protein